MSVQESIRQREADSQVGSGYTIMPLPLQEPIQFTGGTTLTHIHLVFVTCALSFGFVTEHGRLIGTLRRSNLEAEMLKA